MNEAFEKWMSDFRETDEYNDYSFLWGEMAKKAWEAGQSSSAARIAELEAELEFAYKRAKVLADLCNIPVHESPEVTGTILGLVRGHLEQLLSDCKAMAESLLKTHEDNVRLFGLESDPEWNNTCPACLIAAKYK